MATNAKNLAELLNTDTTVKVGDIEDGSVTTAKLASGAAIAKQINSDDAIQVAKLLQTVPFGRDLLINGDFQEWQRGTSGTVNSYTCDRWYGWGNQHNLTQQQADNASQ